MLGYTLRSIVEIHNTEGANNTAGRIGNFAVVTMNSIFQSNYLYLYTSGENSIAILDSSNAEMTHTFLSNPNDYCPIVVETDSNIQVDSIYSTDSHSFNLTNSKNVVCTDESSNSNGNFQGSLFLP